MTKSFSVSVKGWSEKAKRNSRLIVMEASEGVYNAMTTRQAGVKETGGSFEVGKVPVDTGFLVGSAQIAVAGAQRGTGSSGQPPDFMASIAGFDVGQPIEAAFTAEYARAVEYGNGRMAGRFFVRQAVSRWGQLVRTAAARYKD